MGQPATKQEPKPLAVNLGEAVSFVKLTTPGDINGATSFAIDTRSALASSSAVRRAQEMRVGAVGIVARIEGKRRLIPYAHIAYAELVEE